MDWSLLGNTALQTLLVTLISKAAEAGFDALAGSQRDGKDEKFNLSAHLAKTYDRCTKVKTLISNDAPIELKDIYVANYFFHNGQQHTDINVIASLWKNKRIVVSGTAGSGKTFFTRFAWCSVFVDSRGKVPVYVELRRLDEITSDNLEAYIYAETVGSKASPHSQSEFEKAVEDGRFIFILDGFDEVRNEKRDSLERQIIRLSEKGPDNLILVTGRPDEKFKSWQSFLHYQVLPMSKKQVISLLNKIHFEKPVKDKFVKRVKADLYDKHQSFLSTPLLATMMLLSFKAFADIPDKIHVFYEQAFEVLFTRHDAQKEAFKRKLHTNLSIDVFRRQFAYFCILTYDVQKYSFSNIEVLQYLNQVKRLTGDNFDAEEFTKDLIESVCMLQPDGVQIVFSHRSFQEYFTAVGIAELEKAAAAQMLRRYSLRSTDGIIPMLYDMKRELVESELVIPIFAKIEYQLVALAKAKSLREWCDLQKSPLRLYYTSGRKENSPRRIVWMASRCEEFSQLMMLMQRLRPSDFKKSDSILEKAMLFDPFMREIETSNFILAHLAPPRTQDGPDYTVTNFDLELSKVEGHEEIAEAVVRLHLHAGLLEGDIAAASDLLNCCRRLVAENSKRADSVRELILKES